MLGDSETWFLPWKQGLVLEIPSGKLINNYGKSQFLIGKSTISTGPFSKAILVYQRVFIETVHESGVCGYAAVWYLARRRNLSVFWIVGRQSEHFFVLHGTLDPEKKQQWLVKTEELTTFDTNGYSKPHMHEERHRNFLTGRRCDVGHSRLLSCCWRSDGKETPAHCLAHVFMWYIYNITYIYIICVWSIHIWMIFYLEYKWHMKKMNFNIILYNIMQ